MEKISVEGINTNFLNSCQATAPELVAEALDQFGLIDEETVINELNAKEYLKTLAERKKNHLAINRKASFITKIGSLLVQRKIISNLELKEALLYQKHTPIKVGEILVKLGFVEEEEISTIIEEQQKIRAILDKLLKQERMEVYIQYREPEFEKRINRENEEPYGFNVDIQTSDISEAIIEALTIFYSNERLSSVRWRSEITSIRVAMNLKN